MIFSSLRRPRLRAAFTRVTVRISAMFARQIDAVGPAAGGILCEEIQQVTQLDKGTVVVLMCALVQKKINIGFTSPACSA